MVSPGYQRGQKEWDERVWYGGVGGGKVELGTFSGHEPGFSRRVVRILLHFRSRSLLQ